MDTTPKAESKHEGSVLYVVFELAQEEWKIGFGNGRKQRGVTVKAKAKGQVLEALETAKRKLKVKKSAVVHSCYEAGRDGFWLHRWLLGQGVQNRVIDSSSIEVNRRMRRAKTDRLDWEKMLPMLIRVVGGELRVWQEVRVPTVEEEDDRRTQRELKALEEDQTRLVNQMRALLALYGIPDDAVQQQAKHPERLEQHDGQPLPPNTQEQLLRLKARYDLTHKQMSALQTKREEMLQEALRKPEPGEVVTAEQERGNAVARKVFSLMSLCGIGVESSWMLTTEFFAWRRFKNRRQVAGAAGLVPMPYNSGNSEHEQGISKAGNHLVRRMMLQISWGWLRYQPDSDLTRWFNERFGSGGKGTRKKGIVAVARKLLIALWRYVEFEEVPGGARLKELVSLS